MESKKHDLFSHEVLVKEVNSHIRHLKEEIRADFSAHVKSLSLREQWLLDQVDSLKEDVITNLTNRSISLAENHAKVEGCLQFQKIFEESKNDKGLQQTATLLAQLQKSAPDCKVLKDFMIPTVEFTSEHKVLHNGIMSYGNLRMCDYSEDDTASCSSGKSWHLVDDEEDAEQEQEEYTGGCGKPPKKKCCVSGCKGDFEIEDMDVAGLLVDGEASLSGSETDRDEDTAIKSACKANETCNSISECLCESPCLPEDESDVEPYNPVDALRSKLRSVFLSASNDTEEKTPQESDEKLSFVDGIAGSEDPPSNSEQFDLVHQASLKMQSILFGSDSRKLTLPTKRDNQDVLMKDLHAKIQDLLLYGSKDDQKSERESENCFPSYKTLPWESESEKSAINSSLSSEMKRLSFVQGEKSCGSSMDFSTSSKYEDFEKSDFDPVFSLASRLQQVLAN